MSTPAGWYDDGSGRQRWWDGTQWTEHFAPEQQAAPAPSAAVTSDAPTEQYAPYVPPTAQTAAYPGMVGAQPPAQIEKKTPLVGYIALGLAVAGTILAFFPPVVSIFGFFLLFVAFVMSIVGLFLKGNAKWPSIAGLILSVVGAIVGIVMFVLFTVAAVEQFNESLPEPTSSSTEAAPSGTRPTTAEVEEGLAAILEDTGGGNTYTQEQLTCTAQFMVDSDIPDDTLAVIAQGPDAVYSDIDAATQFTEKFAESFDTCLF